MDIDCTDLTVFIAREGAELVTDSRAVAIAFGKRHAHVMRAINAMRASQHPEIAEHYRTNFGLVDFMDAKGERRPMYRMTADGLSELAMGYSGDDSSLPRETKLIAPGYCCPTAADQPLRPGARPCRPWLLHVQSH